jgi:YihY family inner membrane protein
MTMVPHPPSKQENGLLKRITDSLPVETAQKEVRPFIQFYTKLNNDWVFNFAAMLAYNLLMSMFPIALAILSITGLILGNTLNAKIISSFKQLLPSAVSANVVLNIIDKLHSISGFLGIIAVLLAIFFGSRLFITVENCFDIIYHLRPRSLLHQNAIAILMLLLFIILIPIMIAASSGPALAISILQQTPLNAIVTLSPMIYLAGIISGLIAAFILFQVIYMVVPNQNISFQHSWLGALIASIALELYLLLFPLYASHFLADYAGQVGFAVILLVFFYYFSVILLLGAEANAFFLARVQPLPNDLATFTTTLGGKPKDHPDEVS